MNRAIDNWLIEKLLALNLPAPQWRYYFLAAHLFFFGAVFLVWEFIITISLPADAKPRESQTVWFYGILFCLFGNVSLAMGKLVRDAQKAHAEQTKRLTEQDERIRKLEAQLAALSEPTPTLTPAPLRVN